MRDLWLIARYEFWRVVRQRRFLFFAIGMPLFFVAVAMVPIAFELLRGEPSVGYVDESGLLADPILPPEDELDATLVALATEEEGRAALAGDEINSLWIIPQDYLQTGRVRSVVEGEANGNERGAIRSLLRVNLLRDAEPGVAERLQHPIELSYRSLDTGRRVRQGAELIFALLIPVGLALAFALSIAYSAGYLAQAVSEEKENRLMEVITTSTRVWSFIGGKIVGLGAVALSQVLFWGVGLLLAAFVFFLRGEFPSGLPIPWDLLAWAFLFFLLAYALYATILVGIGALVGEAREAQQIAGFLGIMGVVPLWFAPFIVEEPSGTVARALTLFPLTAPILVPVRMALGRIALPEILLSLAILALSTAVALWAVSRLFRAAMLRYGARLSLNTMIDAIARGRT
jgi:ABC-2 type transport system permease protein